MVKAIQKKLSESKTARWSVLALVSFTMMCAYFISDIMSPLKTLLEKEIADGGLGWTSMDFGVFNFSYGWFTVFLFMLIIGGIILDKWGTKFTGVLATGLMLGGVAIKYFVIEYTVQNPDFAAQTLPWLGNIHSSLLYISLGYATFCLGSEIAGITVTRIIARWFAGRELALALGLQVATARLGTAAAFVLCPMLPEWFDFQISAPVMVGLAIMCIGLITFLVFCVMDARLDKEESESNVEQEEPFRVRDIIDIIKVPAFWYIAILCLVFYSAVFPFLKNATDFMFNKYPIDFAYASWIPAMLPFGTILLTPIFGRIYDKVGRGATLMLIGSILLAFVHVVFAVPQITSVAVAIAMMIVLGIAFSLVPSAMWPAVTKIVEPKKLGSAYALIFWLQNVGLMGVPLLINWVLNEYCIVGTQMLDGATINKYDYTTPMVIFAALSFTAIIFAILLKHEDKRKGYGIEEKK